MITIIASDIPDGHVRTGDVGETDGTAETLVTLGVIVLQSDLKLDRLEEVSLLLIVGVFEERLHIGADSGDYKAVMSLE